MARLFRRCTLTKREMQRLVLPIGIWIVATALATLTGPFGTHDAMSFAPRLVYWSVVSAVSVGLSYVAQHWNKAKRCYNGCLFGAGLRLF